jgi:hypothetical protein
LGWIEIVEDAFVAISETFMGALWWLLPGIVGAVMLLFAFAALSWPALVPWEYRFASAITILAATTITECFIIRLLKLK